MKITLRKPKQKITENIKAIREDKRVSYQAPRLAPIPSAEDWAMFEARRILRAAFSEIIYDLGEKKCTKSRHAATLVRMAKVA